MTHEYIGVVLIDNERSVLPTIENTVAELKQQMRDMFGGKATWLYAIDLTRSTAIT